jgi:hypothetical protein
VKIIAFALLFLPLTASAATAQFDLQAQLIVDGKLVATPRVLALPGEAAELSSMTDTSHDKLKIRITASDDGGKIPGGIAMQFEIYYRKGKKIVEADPEIVAKPGEQTSIFIGKKKDVELKIKAVRMVD